ncbi:MAG: hypothetical protein HYU69_08435 [Bacteroidetes bacterium]|nr:hypothetical protein [Bacteroidota bacterium]
MKTTKKFMLAIGMITALSMTTVAQNLKLEKPARTKVTVLNIDSKGVGIDPSQMGNLVRIELDKLDTFEVMDRYDVSYVIEKNALKTDNCYGKLCMVEMGKVIKSDKMFTGSVELIGQSILITMRLIDVQKETIEKTQVVEFLNISQEIPAMINITIRKMFGMTNDNNLVAKLTKRFDYESLTNNPTEEQLRLNGTRMGFTFLTAQTAKYIMSSKDKGGFGMQYPAMFQFGYQFEKQYLNAGRMQALFEFIPMISGLDHGLIIPSITLMNGIRDNRYGWEFAFGPTVNVIKKAKGYYDNNEWKLESEWKGDPASPLPAMIERIDSRGELTLNWGFVFAAGRTFKSGKLNIPVNVHVVPSSDGIRFGASFGFNAKTK